MARKNKNTNLKLVDVNGIAEHWKEKLEDYLASDNRRLAIEIDSVTNNIESHRIESIFAFKDARFEDRWNHDVNRLVHCAMGLSQGIRRLEFLMERTLPTEYEGPMVGSTGTPQGDFDKLLELVANASYAVGVMQGARLQGASDARLEEITRFARL